MTRKQTLQAFLEDLQAVGINILQGNLCGNHGIIVKFPNGNIAKISTGEKHHPLVIEHETAESRKERLSQWYKDDGFDMEIVMETDRTI